MNSVKHLLKRAFPQATVAADRLRRGKRWMRATRLSLMSRRRVFKNIYSRNKWGDRDSRSGPGSNLQETHVIRDALPSMIRELAITSILDVPCGDFHWMKDIDLSDILYTGADIVADMIEANERAYGCETKRFLCLDMVDDPLPKSDLVFCRDAIVHLSNADAASAIENIKKSGATFLLTTTFSDVDRNVDISTGMWRPVNLCKEPFKLPPPIQLLNERYSGQHGRYRDKSIGLWRISDLW